MQCILRKLTIQKIIFENIQHNTKHLNKKIKTVLKLVCKYLTYYQIVNLRAVCQTWRIWLKSPAQIFQRSSTITRDKLDYLLQEYYDTEPVGYVLLFKINNVFHAGNFYYMNPELDTVKFINNEMPELDTVKFINNEIPELYTFVYCPNYSTSYYLNNVLTIYKNHIVIPLSKILASKKLVKKTAHVIGRLRGKKFCFKYKKLCDKIKSLNETQIMYLVCRGADVKYLNL